MEKKEQDFINFFECLLERLNGLSDKAAKFISKTTTFDNISYGAYDRYGGGYSVAGSIKYSRNFNKEDFGRTKKKIAIEEGYTGYTFDQIDGLSFEEFKKGYPNYIYGYFEPSIKVIQTTPKEVDEILKKHKERGELGLDYKPSVEEFFYDWTWNPENNEHYWINPKQIPKGKEKEFIIQFRSLDQNVVQEVETKFPEAKIELENLIKRVLNGRKQDERMIH